MRTVFTWLTRICGALLLAAIVIGVWKRDEITRLWAVTTLFDEDRIVENFSHMDAAFLTRPVPRGDGPVSPLPMGAPARLPPAVADWITTRNVTSLLVLKSGRIVHESYHLGTGPDDLRISWSVAKSYLSALLGVLLDEGAIASLDDPVTRYAPALIGTAYDGASIRNVANMASGVTFDEDYLDPSSDINRMGRVIALGGTLDDFTTALQKRFAEPGQTWTYVSIDTHVLGMVIRGATGRDIASLLSERIIAPLGLEHTPTYLTDGAGTAFVLGGLNMSTRDYARFALMIAQGGRVGPRQVVPEAWIDAATRPSAPTAPGEIGYGYQWWIPVGAGPGQFMARGVYDQYIYIDRPRDVVIVTTAANRQFRDPGVGTANIAVLRAIAEAL